LTRGDYDRRFHEARERSYTELENSNPGYGAAGGLLSTTTRAERRKRKEPTPADVLRDELVPDSGNDIDLGHLLDAVVAVMELAHEATVGVGPGGLFNFEREAVDSLLRIADDLVAGRRKAADAVRRQHMLDELAAIYQATVDSWEPWSGRGRPRTTDAQLHTLSVQEGALREFLKRHELPESRMKRLVRKGPEIVREGRGALKTAALVLNDLGVKSDSTLTKDRRRVHPLYEYRATHSAFPIPNYDRASDEERTATAHRFSGFAEAIFFAASSNPPIYVRPGPEEQRNRRDGLSEVKKLILLSECRNQRRNPRSR